MASVTARVGRRGDVTWRVQFRVEGQMRQESFLDEDGARRFGKLVDRIGGKAARASRLAALADESEVLTLRDWSVAYLDPAQGHIGGVTAATVEGYRLAAERSFLPLLGEMPLGALTRQDVARWVHWQEQQINARTNRPVAAKTVRNHHAVLSAMLTAAVMAGKIPGNVAKGVRLSEGTVQEMVLITPGEFEAVHAHLPDYARPLARFLAGTGMRWGEATALTWSDLNLQVHPATARVTKAWKRGPGGMPALGTPKTRKSVRTVSLPTAVVEELGAPRAAAELVFPGPAGIGQQAWTKRFHRLAWHPAIEAAGIGKKPRVHDLRHSQASWLVAAGVPLPMIQARLGHEKITTTVDTYTHLAPEAHVQMAMLLDREFTRARPALEA